MTEQMNYSTYGHSRRSPRRRQREFEERRRKTRGGAQDAGVSGGSVVASSSSRRASGGRPRSDPRLAPQDHNNHYDYYDDNTRPDYGRERARDGDGETQHRRYSQEQRRRSRRIANDSIRRSGRSHSQQPPRHPQSHHARRRGSSPPPPTRSQSPPLSRKSKSFHGWSTSASCSQRREDGNTNHDRRDSRPPHPPPFSGDGGRRNSNHARRSQSLVQIRTSNGNAGNKSPPILAKQLSGFDLQTKNETYLNASASSFGNNTSYYDDEEGCPRASFGSGSGSNGGSGYGSGTNSNTNNASPPATATSSKVLTKKNAKSSALRITTEAKSYIVNKLSSIPVISGQSCRKKYGPSNNNGTTSSSSASGADDRTNTKQSRGSRIGNRIRSRSRGRRYRQQEEIVVEEEEDGEEPLLQEEPFIHKEVVDQSIDASDPFVEDPSTSDINEAHGIENTPATAANNRILKNRSNNNIDDSRGMMRRSSSKSRQRDKGKEKDGGNAGRRPKVIISSSSRGKRIYQLQDDGDGSIVSHGSEEEEDISCGSSRSGSFYNDGDSAEEDSQEDEHSHGSQRRRHDCRRGNLRHRQHRESSEYNTENEYTDEYDDDEVDDNGSYDSESQGSYTDKECTKVGNRRHVSRQRKPRAQAQMHEPPKGQEQCEESSFVEDDLVSVSSRDDYDDGEGSDTDQSCSSRSSRFSRERSKSRRIKKGYASRRRSSRRSSQGFGDSRPTIDYDMSHLDEESRRDLSEEEKDDSVISGAEDFEDSRAEIVNNGIVPNTASAAAPSRKSSRDKKEATPRQPPTSRTSDLDASMSERSYQLFKIQQENEALRANVNALRKDWEAILQRMNSVDTTATTTGDMMITSNPDFNVSYLSLNTNLKNINEMKSKAMNKLDEKRKKEKELLKKERERLSLSQQEKDFRQSYEACIEDLLCENERLFSNVITLSEEREEILEEVRTLRDASVKNHNGLLTDEDMAQMHENCLKHIDALLRGIQKLAPSDLHREKSVVMGEGILKLVKRIMTQKLDDGSVVVEKDLEGMMEECEAEATAEKAEEEKKEEDRRNLGNNKTNPIEEQEHELDDSDDISVTSSTASVLGNNALALTTVENKRRSSQVSTSSQGTHRSTPDDEEEYEEEEYSDDSSSGYDEYEVIEEYYTDSEEEYEEEVDYHEDYGESFVVNNMSTNSLFDSSSPHVSFGTRSSRIDGGSADSCNDNVSQLESSHYIRPDRPESFMSGGTHSTDVQDPPRGYHPSFYSSSSSATEDFQTGERQRNKYNQSFVSTSSHFSSIKEDYAEDSEEDDDDHDDASSQYSKESGSHSSEYDSYESEEESYYEYPDDEDMDEVRTNYDESELVEQGIADEGGSPKNDVENEEEKHEDECNEGDDPASFTKPHYGYQTQATCSESCSASDYDNDTIPSMGSESTKENKGISLTVVIRSSRYTSFPSTKEHSIVSFFTSSLLKSQVDAVLEEQLRESMAALDSMVSVQTETTQRTGSLSSTRSKRKQKKKKYQGEFNGTGERHGYGIYISKNGNEYRGEWQHNKREGLGVVKVGNGDVFEGQFENNMKNGVGVYHYSDGECDLSLYLDDTRVGNTFRWSVDRKRSFIVSSESGMREVSLDEAARLAREIGVVVAY